MTVVAPPLNAHIDTSDLKNAYKNRFVDFYFQQVDISSHSHLKQVLESHTGFIIENPTFVTSGQLGVSKNLKPHQISKTKQNFNKPSNIGIIDFEPHKTLSKYIDKSLNTIEDVCNFIDTYIKLPSYVISKSFSHVENPTVKHSRWHVWFAFDHNFSLQKFKQFLEVSLPDDCWYQYIDDNGTTIKTNAYIDMTVYSHPSRFFVEHPSAEYFIKDNGLNSFFSMQQRADRNAHKIKNKTYVNPQTLEQIAQIESRIASKPQAVNRDLLEKGFVTYDTELYLPNGTIILARDLLFYKDKTRLTALHNMHEGQFNGDMEWNPRSQTLYDYTASSGGSYKLIENLEKTMYYNTKYLPIELLDLSHKNTFILAPTGSGKTTNIMKLLENTPTIFLAPKKAIVKDNGGLESGLTHWNDVNVFGLTCMTNHKLFGHIETQNVPLDEFTIVIDEVHMFFQNPHAKEYLKLFEWLMLRKKKFNKLIMLTATLDYNVLPVKDLVSYKYINTSTLTHIDFYKNVGEIETLIKGRTLVFIQSRKRVAALYDRFSKTHKVLSLMSGEEIPENFEEYDLIITTSVLREGFSIKTHIDTVIIYNTLQPIGAYDLLQSLARPRDSQPEIKIIAAQSHFTEENVVTPTLSSLQKLAHDILEGYEIDDIRILQAINLEKFKTHAFMLTTDKDGETYKTVNQLGVISYYLSVMRNLETSDFNLMTKTMKSFLNCETTLTVFDNKSNLLPQIDKLVKDLEAEQKSLKTFKEADAFIEKLESLAESSKQIIEILNSLSEERISILETKEGIYHLTEEQRVQWQYNPSVYTKLNQHRKNINEGVYDLMNTNRAWREQTEFTLGGLKKIFKILDKQKKSFRDDEVLTILNKLCVYKKLNSVGAVIKRGKIHKIRVLNKRLYELSKIPEVAKKIKVNGI